MRKRGAYQKQKEQFNRISNVLISLLLGLLVIALFVSIVQSICTLGEIADGTLCEYSGEYTITKTRLSRNTVYLFTLGNGDRIHIAPEYLENISEMESSTELRFRYSTLIGVVPWGTHIAVSIEATDDDFVFLSEVTSKSDILMRIVLYIIFIVLILLIPLLLFLDWGLVNKRKIR